jgi:hypothetical protein
MDNRPRGVQEFGWYVTLSQIGFEMVAPIFLGWGLDVWLGTQPWLTVAGAVFGFVGGMAHLLVMLQAPKDKKIGPRNSQ